MHLAYLLRGNLFSDDVASFTFNLCRFVLIPMTFDTSLVAVQNINICLKGLTFHIRIPTDDNISRRTNTPCVWAQNCDDFGYYPVPGLCLPKVNVPCNHPSLPKAAVSWAKCTPVRDAESSIGQEAAALAIDLFLLCF